MKEKFKDTLELLEKIAAKYGAKLKLTGPEPEGYSAWIESRMEAEEAAREAEEAEE